MSRECSWWDRLLIRTLEKPTKPLCAAALQYGHIWLQAIISICISSEIGPVREPPFPVHPLNIMACGLAGIKDNLAVAQLVALGPDQSYHAIRGSNGYPIAGLDFRTT